MKQGKISETVYKRSILKEIKYKRLDIVQGASLLGDCSAVSTEDGEILTIITYTNLYSQKAVEELSVNALVNKISASGAEAVGISITMILPEYVLESDLKQMMRNYNFECEKKNIQIIGTDIEFSDAVSRPVITLTGIGKVKQDRLLSFAKCKPGQDIVMSKSIGIEGTYIISLIKKEELSKRFSLNFLNKLINYKDDLSIVNEATVAIKHGVTAMHNIARGGIFGALWEIGLAAKSGVKVDLKSIIVNQETIEICELFNLNPYQIISGGSLLMVTDDGEELVNKLRSDGIISSVIGKITSGNDKIIMNEEEIRFLEPPKNDEIEKIS